MQAPAIQELIGYELTDVRRRLLVPADAAFVLQLPVREVRNAIRRGAVPVVRAGRTNRIEAVDLAAQLHAANHADLAVEFLRGWVEGRFEMPRPADGEELPSSLVARLDLLRRPLPEEDRRRGPARRVQTALGSTIESRTR